MNRISRRSDWYLLILILAQMPCGCRLGYARTPGSRPVGSREEQTPTNESVVKKEIETLTHHPREYWVVWSKISGVQSPLDPVPSDVAARNRIMLRIQVIKHLRELLAKCNRKTIPDIPPLVIPDNQAFRSGMGSTGITDETFRKHYEHYLRATQQTLEIVWEKDDLESMLHRYKSLFVSTSQSEIGIQKTKVLVDETIDDLPFRRYLLALLE